MEPAPLPTAPASSPERRVRVGLDVDGGTLRYAAVAHVPGEKPRLLRLGSAAFGPDFAGKVYGTAPGTAATDALGRAVAEMLRDEKPDAIRLVVHAPHLPGFFVPVADGLPAPERYDRLRRETLLLADAAAEPVLRVQSRPVRVSAVPEEAGEGGHLVWHRTQLVPGALHERLDRLARRVGAVGRGGARYDILDGSEAAAALARAVDEEARAVRYGLSLSVGLYAGGAELSVWKDGHPYHDRRIEAGARGLDGLMDDVAYFATAILHTFGLDAGDLEDVYLYGPRANTVSGDSLAELFGAPARWLDASALFGARLGTVDPAFAPAIGAALVRL
jgi:hypothetical protein